MMRALAFVTLIILADCGGSKNKDLPLVKDSDPVWQLNADRWAASVNDLITPPGDGTPQPKPAPAKVEGSSL